MKKKIVGIFVCMLMIVTALPATGIMNDKIIWFLKENKYSGPYTSTPVNSPSLITIKITAKVINVYDEHNLLGGTIKVGDKITGKYTYDSATPDSEPDPKMGEYYYNSPPCGIEVKAGELVFKTDPNDVEFVIGIINDFDYYPYLFGDIYILLSDNNLNLSNGLIVQGIYWILLDNSGTALSNDDLPTTAPVLSDWNQSPDSGLVIEGKDPSNPYTYSIQAEVTKATKSRARDVHFNMPPILIWLLERFPNIFPILRQLMKLKN